MTTIQATTGLGWTDDAACVDVPELPWIGPRRGQPLDAADLEEMIQTCDRCPVLEQCRRYVEQADVTAGFWAGAWRHLAVDDCVEGRVVEGRVA